MPAQRPQRPDPGHALLLPRVTGDATGEATQRAFDRIALGVQQQQAKIDTLQSSSDEIAPGRLLRTPRILTGSGTTTLTDGTCMVILDGVGQGGGAGGSSGVRLRIIIGSPGVPIGSLAVSWTAGSSGGSGGSVAGGSGSAGADSTISIAGTAYTMKGGGFGQGMP